MSKLLFATKLSQKRYWSKTISWISCYQDFNFCYEGCSSNENWKLTIAYENIFRKQGSSSFMKHRTRARISIKCFLLHENKSSSAAAAGS